MSTLAATFVIDENNVESQNVGDASTASGDSRRAWVSQPESPGWEFMAVGASWEQDLAPDTTPLLEVRVSQDGDRWSEWTALPELDDQPDHSPTDGTDLLFVRGKHVQLRAALYDAEGEARPWDQVQLTVIDARNGPSVEEATRATVSSAASGPRVISRRDWGANESYRYNKSGEEKWSRRYYEMKAFFVHHSATSPSYPDPAAAVRSIYYYHAVTLGWGDIGYHYIIDQYGNIYEGRFASERSGLVAAGGHALGYNESTMGISVIGNYQNQAPADSSIRAVTGMLAHRADRYGIDPRAPVWLPGTRSSRHPGRWFDYSVLGHRDTHEPRRTSCPGDAFFARLPEIREDTIRQMEPPTVQLSAPEDNTLLQGMMTFQANASPNTARVEYRLADGANADDNGSLIAYSDSPPWQVEVNSRSLPATPAGDPYRLRAVALTAAGISAYDERSVRVATVGGSETGSPARDPETETSAATGNHEIYLPILRRFGDCVDLAQNGNFNRNTDWVLLRGHYAGRYTSEQASTGQYSLRVGMAPGDSYPSWSSARLKLEIPSDVEQVTLRLQYLPQTSNPAGDDKQYLGILDEDGRYIESIIPPANRHEQSWQRAVYDLTEYKGQTIYLYAGVHTTLEGNNVRLYIDDVEVEACK